MYRFTLAPHQFKSVIFIQSTFYMLGGCICLSPWLQGLYCLGGIPSSTRHLKKHLKYSATRVLLVVQVQSYLQHFVIIFSRKVEVRNSVMKPLRTHLRRLLSCLPTSVIMIFLLNFIRKNLLDGFCLTSANDEHERSILTKLKQQCGGQFTSKMEGMVTDLTLAKENHSHFEEYLGNNPHVSPGIDLTVTVLTTGFWPSYKSFDLNLPAEMVQCFC